MKTITMSEILTDEQCAEIVTILKTAEDGKVVRAIVDYLKPFRKQLEDKGVLPEYLAWFLYAKNKGII